MNDAQVTRYLETRFYPNSTEALRQYVAKKHSDRSVLFLAIVLKELGRLDEAAECCRRALTLNPNNADAQNNLGIIHKEKGQLAQALECYRQAIVNKVVPREKLMATCEEMAEMICDSSPLAVQAAVRLYRLTAAFPPSLVSYARDLDQIVAESEDGAEGPRAFREKRKPVWKMR